MSTSSSMDVDPSPNNKKEGEETRIAVHPLAIVHMSDQYTRISYGGSPLDKNAPVVGLLFGSRVEDSPHVLQIHDADDIPTDISEASTIQVNLHKAVFPQHSVVGWYRVSLVGGDTTTADASAEPTLSDLQITQQLKQHYTGSGSGSGTGTDASTSASSLSNDDLFVFCLLQVASPKSSVKVAATTDAATNTKNNSLLTTNQELPINLYELYNVASDTTSAPGSTTTLTSTSTSTKNTILLGISHSQWKLETSEPERIAVERVMKEPPAAEKSQNLYVTHTKLVQLSLMSMKDRVQILMEFLEETQLGTIPPNWNLLRQVQGLLYSMGPLMTLVSNMSTSPSSTSSHGHESSNNNSHCHSEEQDAELLAHLAAVAKVVGAVQSYTDKFRVLHENRTMTKEMRRPF